MLATSRLPGPAWNDLPEVEIATLDRPREDVEILIVTNDAVALDHFPALRLIANNGVGYDRIDVDDCRLRGIAVTNTPRVLAVATADLTTGLILAVRRRIVEGDATVRSRSWSKVYGAAPFLGSEVTGATLGLVGFGEIGRAVARVRRHSI